MGSIYRRGRIWWIKYYRYGRPHAESTKTDDLEVAKRLLKQREGEISKGQIPGIYFERVRFDELAEDLLADYVVNENKTLDNAEQNVARLKVFFGGMRITDITTPRIAEYIESRRKDGVVNATINRELSGLKRMLNLGFRATPPKVGHMPHIPMLKERNIRKGFFEHDEFKKLKAALPDYLKPVVTFAYYLGWRREEILGLTWEKVDLAQRVVRLEPGETKNEDGRTIVLNEELFKMMLAQKAVRRLRCPYVFHQRGEKIGEFRKTWITALIKSGIGAIYRCKNCGATLEISKVKEKKKLVCGSCKSKKLKWAGKIFHDFRRTAVRNMVRAGIPERVAMRISGHKTRSIFDRYNIISEEDLREAADRQANFLKNQEENVALAQQLQKPLQFGQKAGRNWAGRVATA